MVSELPSRYVVLIRRSACLDYDTEPACRELVEPVMAYANV
jgi:hypothetical protein